jgi:hypothetical protein
MQQLDDWIAMSRAWLDEQMRIQRALDEAAWLRFRRRLLPFD